ncbi:MAG: transglutaminase domain-containing protein [Anaerolineae bacterium]|nr:transglutaminase domain-containing protein [Anaerolineae bacterium]
MYNRTTYYHSGLGGKLLFLVGGKSLLMWVLLLIALASAVYGITDVLWGLEFPFLFFVAVTAMTLQWMLANLSFSDRWAAVCGAVFGVEYVLLRGGELGAQVFAIIRTSFALIGDMFIWLWGDLMALWVWVGQWYWNKGIVIVGRPIWAVGPEWKRLLWTLLELWSNMSVMLSQSRQWLWTLLGGEPVFDPVATILVWGMLIWGLASWAGWVVHRHRNALLALLPLSAVLTFVISYTGATAFSIVPLLGCGLIMFGMLRHRIRETDWLNRGIEYSEDLWSNLLLSVSLLTLVVMLVAVAVPEFTPKDIADWINEVLYGDVEKPPMEDLADSLGMEQQPKPAVEVAAGLGWGPGLPGEHTVGAGQDLSQRRVMLVNTGDLPPISDEGFDPILLEFDPPLYHWRSATFDTYTGRSWIATDTEDISYEAGAPLFDPETLEIVYPHHRVLHQTVRRSSGTGNIVHVAGELLSVDQSYTAAWRSNNPQQESAPAGSAPAGSAPTVSVSEIMTQPVRDFFGAVTDEAGTPDIYEAISLLPEFTEQELREVNGEYPDWLLDRYLQLPEEVPQRVLDLVHELTDDIPKVYDKALMLESYLRTFTYTLEVPAPPENQEVADFFLFNLQQGHCDYFATTMAVMARAAGIPARMVLGYASGSYDYGNAHYVVVEADSHAWVEVYFPEYGWIEFEPTSGRPAIHRVSGLTTEFELPTPVSPPEVPAVEEEPPAWRNIATYRWILIGLVIVTGIALVLLSIMGIDMLFLLWWHDAETMLKRLYHRLQRYAQRLQVPARVSDTAYEFVTAFDKRLAEIAGPEEPQDGPLAVAGRDVHLLMDTYVQALYSPRPVDVDAQRVVAWTWWKLRWRLWFAWLVHRKIV